MCIYIYTVYKTKTYKNTFVLTPLLAGMYFNLYRKYYGRLIIKLLDESIPAA